MSLLYFSKEAFSQDFKKKKKEKIGMLYIIIFTNASGVFA